MSPSSFSLRLYVTSVPQLFQSLTLRQQKMEKKKHTMTRASGGSQQRHAKANQWEKWHATGETEHRYAWKEARTRTKVSLKGNPYCCSSYCMFRVIEAFTLGIIRGLVGRCHKMWCCMYPDNFCKLGSWRASPTAVLLTSCKSTRLSVSLATYSFKLRLHVWPAAW